METFIAVLRSVHRETEERLALVEVPPHPDVLRALPRKQERQLRRRGGRASTAPLARLAELLGRLRGARLRQQYPAMERWSE